MVMHPLGFFNCVAKGQGQGERHLKLRALLRTCTEVAKVRECVRPVGLTPHHGLTLRAEH